MELRCWFDLIEANQDSSGYSLGGEWQFIRMLQEDTRSFIASDDVGKFAALDRDLKPAL
jgi:hypothetical protein